MTDLILLTPTSLRFGDAVFECRIGRAGLALPGEKREGDLKTPSGVFALRPGFFRPDRAQPPASAALPFVPLTPEDGWCDDATHALYNQPVKLPFAGRHEQLWRDDSIYDVIIPLGYNDSPVVPGMGSAIFMHVMREDGVGTEGCIALKMTDLIGIIANISAAACIHVHAS